MSEMPNILVVEDNELNADMLLRRLQRKGYAARHARNGQEALDMIAVAPPDLVLMDLSLPVMDGYEAARHIKAGPYAHIPVIALTAHALVEDKAKALAAGCDDYDTKPVDFTRLQSKINHYLEN